MVSLLIIDTLQPLCERIPKLDKSIPIYFIYGTQDWMDASKYYNFLNNHSCNFCQ
jgi:hypothetical protein